jgi:hypothetical protein
MKLTTSIGEISKLEKIIEGNENILKGKSLRIILVIKKNK